MAGSIAHAPPSEPIDKRDMDSTPPAMTKSSKPERTFMAAKLTASKPDAQKRLICTPATVSAKPAAKAAVLAISAPWSPTGVTQPNTTSSAKCLIAWPLRSAKAFIKPTTKSMGLMVCKEPSFLPLPRGVRTAS